MSEIATLLQPRDRLATESNRPRVCLRAFSALEESESFVRLKDNQQGESIGQSTGRDDILLSCDKRKKFGAPGSVSEHGRSQPSRSDEGAHPWNSGGVLREPSVRASITKSTMPGRLSKAVAAGQTANSASFEKVSLVRLLQHCCSRANSKQRLFLEAFTRVPLRGFHLLDYRVKL
eukprot:scaffold33700_cov30-Tisochrysis_lutea.AAC.3